MQRRRDYASGSRHEAGSLKSVGKKELALFALLVLVCALTALKSPNFLSIDNMVNQMRLIGMFGIFSIGAGMVIITGGIDLSVGSMFALLGVVLAMLLTGDKTWPKPFTFLDGSVVRWPIAVVLTIGLGALLGTFHSFLITRVKLQPFIVTLCGLLLYRGFARYLAQDDSKGFREAKGFEPLKAFTKAELFGFDVHLGRLHVVFPGLPMSFVILIVLGVAAWVVLHRSVYGRHLFATGRNEEAARYSGIDTKKIIGSTYILSGFLAAISGILFAFDTNSITPSMSGNFYELYGIAAAVLGGCSLRGGEGSIIGIVLGTILLQILQNLVNLLGIDSSLNFAVMGVVILAGVLADQLLANRSRKTRATPTS